VYAQAAEDLINGTKEKICEALHNEGRGSGLSAKLKEVLSQYLYQQTKRRPMVIPVVTEV
jgi:ribonuclease J